MAADTEEAGARWCQERSTYLSEQVAVNITRSSVLAVGRTSRIGDAELETLQHAGEVVRMPAVPEYQGDGDRLGVLTRSKVTGRSAEQLLEVVVYVQLLKDGLD